MGEYNLGRWPQGQRGRQGEREGAADSVKMWSGAGAGTGDLRFLDLQGVGVIDTGKNVLCITSGFPFCTFVMAFFIFFRRLYLPS